MLNFRKRKPPPAPRGPASVLRAGLGANGKGRKERQKALPGRVGRGNSGTVVAWWAWKEDRGRVSGTNSRSAFTEACTRSQLGLSSTLGTEGQVSVNSIDAFIDVSQREVLTRGRAMGTFPTVYTRT